MNRQNIEDRKLRINNKKLVTWRNVPGGNAQCGMPYSID